MEGLLSAGPTPCSLESCDRFVLAMVWICDTFYSIMQYLYLFVIFVFDMMMLLFGDKILKIKTVILFI